MGFGTRSQGGRVFMSPAKGFITTKCKEGDRYGSFKAISYEISAGEHEGEIAHQFRFPDVEAHITNISIVESKNPKFSDQASIDMVDKGAEPDDRFKKFSLQFSVTSPYFKFLVQCLDNININSPVCLEPFYLKSNRDEGMFNSGFSIYQNGERVPYAITKEELPEGHEEKRGGKKVWNKDDQIEFLLNKFHKWCKKNKMGEFKPEEEEEQSQGRGSSKQKREKESYSEDDEDEPKASSKKSSRRPVDDDEDDENPY